MNKKSNHSKSLSNKKDNEKKDTLKKTDLDEEKIEEFVKKNPEKVLKIVQTSSIHGRMQYEGPIPPASELKKYDDIEKGLAKEIINLAKLGAEGEIELHKLNLENNSKIIYNEKISLEITKKQTNHGTIITLAFMAGGFYLLINGDIISGLGSFAVPLFYHISKVVTNYLSSNNKNTKEK